MIENSQEKEKDLIDTMSTKIYISIYPSITYFAVSIS